MTHGRCLLLQFLNRSGLNQTELADELGLRKAHLSKILTGRLVPRIAIAARIQRRTGVPIESWVAPDVSGARKARGRKANSANVSGRETAPAAG